MATLYIKEQGAHLHVRGDRFLVTKGGEDRLDVPAIKVDRVVVMGRGVQVSTAALVYLFRRGVPVVYTNQAGVGRPGPVITPLHNDASLLVALVRLLDSPARTLPIVRAVVVGKLANQIALLRARPQLWGAAGPRAVAIMERARQDAARAADADSARGYEGVGAAAYWQAWQALLGPSWGFSGREYHPPRDPVNALLSFGYTLLLNELLVNVQKSGLHPGLGFFHTVQFGRPSLALDVEEEFRPLIIDPLVLSLLERRVISRTDFAAPPDPPGALYLTPAGRDRFIPAYEEWVQQRVYYPHTKRPQPPAETWRRCLALQVQQMARVISGEQAEYRPLITPVAVRPGDVVEPAADEDEEE